MRDEEFRRAMNTVGPTPEQKERMRAALESQLPQMEKRRYQSRPEKVKRFSWLPAVAALLAVAIGGGLALMKGMLPTGQKSDAVAVESTADSTVETTDYMQREGHPTSLKVLLSFPEYQARQVMERYGAEAMNKLVREYGLTVEEEGADTDGWELANQLGIQKGSDGFTVTGGRYYEKSGSSSFDGTTTMEGVENWTYPISYRVCFNAWGAVVPELPVLEEYSAYGGWSTYTASNGAILILALGQDSGVIYGLADGGFYVVYTQDIRRGGTIMLKKDLEAFAETFHFPLNAYQRDLAREARYAAVFAQYMDVMEGGNGSWNQDAAAAIRARGKESFGYTFWDLDEDGSDELLMTDGTYLYGVYTGSGVTAGAVLHDDGETAYLICADGTILQREEDAFYVYRVEGPKLMTVESLSAQSDPTAPWLRFTKDGTTVLTEEEYDQVRRSYRYIALPVTPLFSWSGYGEYVQERLRGKDDPVDPAYEGMIEAYRMAITQGIQPDKFGEFDISLGIATVEDPLDTIGYCLRDLDGDGEDELIITDGGTLYGVYTLENGKAKSILCSWERCRYYLCGDGYLYSEGSGGAAVTYYEFIRLEDGRMFTVESLMTDYSSDPESPWFRLSTGTDDTVTPITEEEFNHALIAHGEIQKDLSFTPLSQA